MLARRDRRGDDPRVGHAAGSVGLAVALVPAGCAELLQRRPRVAGGLAQRGGAAWLVVLGIGGADPVLEVAERDANGAAAARGDHVDRRVEAVLFGERLDLRDVGVGQSERLAGVLEVVAVVAQAEAERAVGQQRAALLVGEVAEVLGDEHQPQRVVARAARVLVQPRPRRGRLGERPALLDDQLALARPRAEMVERAVDARPPQPLHLPLDVLDGREHQRRREPLGQAGEVEQRQRRVRRDGGGPVGDVAEAAVLPVGLEAQQQRLQPVRVARRSVRRLRGAVGERVDEQLLARSLSGLAREPVRGFDAGPDQRLLVGVERPHASLGVVRVPDQQRVQREQQLGLVRRHAGRVGDVPRADHVAAGVPDLHAPGAGDQRRERVVVPGALGVAVLVGGGGAVEDERRGRPARCSEGRARS